MTDSLPDDERPVFGGSYTRSEIAEYVARSRAKQGLPRYVEDPEALTRVAKILIEARRRRVNKALERSGTETESR